MIHVILTNQIVNLKSMTLCCRVKIYLSLPYLNVQAKLRVDESRDTSVIPVTLLKLYTKVLKTNQDSVNPQNILFSPNLGRQQNN